MDSGTGRNGTCGHLPTWNILLFYDLSGQPGSTCLTTLTIQNDFSYV